MRNQRSKTPNTYYTFLEHAFLGRHHCHLNMRLALRICLCFEPLSLSLASFAHVRAVISAFVFAVSRISFPLRSGIDSKVAASRTARALGGAAPRDEPPASLVNKPRTRRPGEKKQNTVRAYRERRTAANAGGKVRSCRREIRRKVRANNGEKCSEKSCEARRAPCGRQNALADPLRAAGPLPNWVTGTNDPAERC